MPSRALSGVDLLQIDYLYSIVVAVYGTLNSKDCVIYSTSRRTGFSVSAFLNFNSFILRILVGLYIYSR